MDIFDMSVSRQVERLMDRPYHCHLRLEKSGDDCPIIGYRSDLKAYNHMIELICAG